MAQLDFHTALAKWLKKAKLRDGSHSVGLTAEGTFFYRGFPLGFIAKKELAVLLKWPATLKDKSYPFGEEEVIPISDPKCFEKLRNALRTAMTAINKVSINLGKQRPIKQ